MGYTDDRKLWYAQDRFDKDGVRIHTWPPGLKNHFSTKDWLYSFLFLKEGENSNVTIAICIISCTINMCHADNFPCYCYSHQTIINDVSISQLMAIPTTMAAN